MWSADRSPAELIDRARYPIATPGVQRSTVVDHVRTELADDGCAVLPGFLSDDGLAVLLGEARDRAPRAFYADKKVANVHLGDDDATLGPDHPRNRFMPRTNGFVRADEWDDSTASWQLYRWPPLGDFLADCLGRDELHIYDDPVSNMIVNVQRSGQEFNWHFDTNEFTITMLLQAAERGGRFEYVPNLRTPADERVGEVNAVLDGERSRVRTLDLRPGDLQFFLGRFSLHRVTPTEGATERLLLIMSFAEEAGMVGSVQRIRTLYGKVTDTHVARAGARRDGLAD